MKATLDDLDYYEQDIVESLIEKQGISPEEALSVFESYQQVVIHLDRYIPPEDIADIILNHKKNGITAERWLRHIKRVEQIPVYGGEITPPKKGIKRPHFRDTLGPVRKHLPSNVNKIVAKQQTGLHRFSVEAGAVVSRNLNKTDEVNGPRIVQRNQLEQLIKTPTISKRRRSRKYPQE